MTKRKYMMQGLTRYKAKAIQKRAQRQSSSSAGVNPCGLTIRKVIDLCGRGYAIPTTPCRVPVNELWRYREFTWSPKLSFHPHDPNDGSWPGLRDWLKRTKWPDTHPLHFNINPQSGVAKVADGNHRLIVAKSLKLKTASVSFVCRATPRIYEMLRPDWGTTIKRPYMSEESQAKSVARQKRRNWKMIEGGYAKYFHKNIRAARKEINRALHSKEYLHYVRRTGNDPCGVLFKKKLPRQVAKILKHIPKEQSGAWEAWGSKVKSQYMDVMQCTQRYIDYEKRFIGGRAAPSSSKSSPPAAKHTPTSFEQKQMSLMLKQMGL